MGGVWGGGVKGMFCVVGVVMSGENYEDDAVVGYKFG